MTAPACSICGRPLKLTNTHGIITADVCACIWGTWSSTVSTTPTKPEPSEQTKALHRAIKASQ